MCVHGLTGRSHKRAHLISAVVHFTHRAEAARYGVSVGGLGHANSRLLRSPLRLRRYSLRTGSQHYRVSWQFGSQGTILISLLLLSECFGRAFKLRRLSQSWIRTHCGPSRFCARTIYWATFGATLQERREGDWQTLAGCCIITNTRTWRSLTASRASICPRLLASTYAERAGVLAALSLPVTEPSWSEVERQSKVRGCNGCIHRPE